ncbi:O-antigen ligase family protein [Reichenbachiella versicolor]|uniref:O-antigen ligase family protein n=1 Tax=Reichenbachiella versicolor TaxID=1821036 RepID=UPI0013A565D3|nr:O-antigen ligase family protein [Reichenbachiella versicolor]
MAFLLVDAANGFFLHKGVTTGAAEIFKLLLFLLLFLRVIELGKVEALCIFAAIVFAFVHSMMGFFVTSNLSYLKEEMVFASKVIFIPLSYVYFKKLVEREGDNFIGKVKTIIKTNFVVLIINLLLGVLGFGYAQYGGTIGSVGFFFSGNEVSGVQLILSGFILFFSIKKKKTYLLVSFLVLILAMVKATKVAILGTVILILYLYFLHSRKKSNNIFIFKYGLILLVVSPMLFFLVKVGIEQSGLINRLIHFYSNKDLLTFIMSGRNIYAKIGLDLYMNTFSFLEMMFGIGMGRLSEIFSVPFYGLRNTVEIDFFDFLLYYGLIGVLINFGFWAYLTIKSYVGYRKHADYGAVVFATNLLLVFASFTGGHIMYSGMLGVFIGLSNSLISYKQDGEKKID